MSNPVLEEKTKEFQQKVNDAPKRPGVYIYKNKSGKPIYVGKAKILFNRVKSYFNNFVRLDTQKQMMVYKARDIEIITVDSEFEALILETNLIKKYRPRYNIMMKDDKNYVWVKMDKKRRSNQPPPTYNSTYQDFPSIKVVRKKKDDGAEYYGPFPGPGPVKRVLKRLRKIFPYTTAKHKAYQITADPLTIENANKKPDMYYHIGLSNGADAGLESKEEYNKRFDNLRKFFKGEKQSIVNELEKEMKEASGELHFEKAAKLRNRIRDLKYAATNIRLDNTTDDVLIEELKDKERNEAINHLIGELHFPEEYLKNHKNFRIECYDISNTQGTNAVGSMVVMMDGEITPRLYRRFKIQRKNTPNDFAMMQEVLTRRFKHLIFSQNNQDLDDLPTELIKRAKNWKQDESFEQLPDLIIVDGGKGQLSAAYKILYQFNLHNTIPLVGLAKRNEELFRMTYQFQDDSFQVNDLDNFSRIWLSRGSEALFLVQRIRDEAHRFAITYHKKLRGKAMVNR